MSNNKDSELKDIIEGFQLFSSEKDGKINPNEFKEIMDIMNINEKNPFLYNIVLNLCSNEDFVKNGGIKAEDFISLLDQEINDISSTDGLQKIFSIFSNPNNNKIPINSFTHILNEDKDENFKEDKNKFQNLISRPGINGKEIDFNEFHNIIKPESQKSNLIYIKKSNIHKDFSNSLSNSTNKRNKNEINNNINSNHESNSLSENKDNVNIELNNENDENNINDDDINKIELDNNISNFNENQDNLEEEKEENDDINNFDNINNNINTKEEINISQKKYNYMNKRI